MALVRLPSGGLLVHSPTWNGDGTFERVEAVGRPEVLLAPNYFHHVSLPRFRERWPSARAVCSDRARPRLTKKGHANLGGLADVALPKGARFLELPHLKNGEVWLSLPGDGGPTWIVCDGFFHMCQPVTGVQGWVMRRMKVVPGLKFGFPLPFLIEDKRAYRAWLLETLRAERPRRVIFSHGDPLVDDATEKLIEVTERRLIR
jgi:hypothetical protein